MKLVDLSYASERMSTDILTKGLPSAKHRHTVPLHHLASQFPDITFYFPVLPHLFPAHFPTCSAIPEAKYYQMSSKQIHTLMGQGARNATLDKGEHRSRGKTDNVRASLIAIHVEMGPNPILPILLLQILSGRPTDNIEELSHHHAYCNYRGTVHKLEEKDSRVARVASSETRGDVGVWWLTTAVQGAPCHQHRPGRAHGQCSGRHGAQGHHRNRRRADVYTNEPPCKLDVCQRTVPRTSSITGVELRDYLDSS
ncbi:hypothetical protein PR048_006168 [Dryococelus australis]|uniref:Uncharacterized protein n=1 Tax=Dryococelus australis TaxID=614101 RepID=A0ABQ9IA73_9NEOP|nr:hypothetical protein PR048_006168 [Dryococelus australis]